jgi:hypothetical protein
MVQHFYNMHRKAALEAKPNLAYLSPTAGPLNFIPAGSVKYTVDRNVDGLYTKVKMSGIVKKEAVEIPD